MTHERLASLWSTLSTFEDLTVCIRDAAGQYALSSSLSRQDVSTGSDVLLTYAVELITIFDFIRTSNNPTARCTGLRRIHLRSTHILSALTHLLHNIGLQNITNSSQKQRTALSVQIIVRALLSAICAINSFVEEQDSAEIQCVANAARDLASQLPLDSGCFSLLRNVCGYIVNLSSKTPSDTATGSQIKWHDIYSSVGITNGARNYILTYCRIRKKTDRLSLISLFVMQSIHMYHPMIGCKQSYKSAMHTGKVRHSLSKAV